MPRSPASARRGGASRSISGVDRVPGCVPADDRSFFRYASAGTLRASAAGPDRHCVGRYTGVSVQPRFCWPQRRLRFRNSCSRFPNGAEANRMRESSVRRNRGKKLLCCPPFAFPFFKAPRSTCLSEPSVSAGPRLRGYGRSRRRKSFHVAGCGNRPP